MTASPDDRLRGRFLFLDGVRGIAAVLIALFHFNNQWVSPTYKEFTPLIPAPIWAVWRHLDLGVEIFFVISGFVIAHSLWGKSVSAGFVGNFIARFMTRLSPPYWAVLFVTMAWPYLVFPSLVVGFFAAFGGWTGLLINMFYLPDVLSRPRMVPVAWTVFLEVQFYLAFIGMLWLGALGDRRSPKLGHVMIALPFGVLTALSLAHWLRIGSYDFPGHWWTFASGSIVYAALRLRWRAGWIVGFVMLLTAASIGANEPRSGMVAASCAGIFLVASIGKLQTWLAWPTLQYLGRISYSLYLVHIPVGVATIATVQRFGDVSHTSLTTGVFGALLMAILVADLLNRAVEMPAARLSARMRRH